jgi:hypothetical protein
MKKVNLIGHCLDGRKVAQQWPHVANAYMGLDSLFFRHHRHQNLAD